MLTKTTFKQYVAAFLTAAMLIPATSYAEVGRFAGPANFAQKAAMHNGQARTVKKGPKLPAPAKKSIPKFKEIPNANKLPVMKRPGASQISGTAVGEIYGLLIFSSDWTTDPFYGIYKFDFANNSYSEYASDNNLSGAGTYVDGKVYVNAYTEFWGMLMDCQTYVYDFATKEIVDTYVHGTEDLSQVAVNMTMDPTTGIIYSINYSADASSFELCTFEDGSYTPVGNLGESSLFAMTIDKEGQLYVIDSAGDVYKMDKTNAQLGDMVTSTGFSPQYMQSACWSPLDKKIIWAASNETESEVISIDPVSGEVETLSVFSKSEEFTCLFSTDPFADEAAPGRPTVEVAYAQPGALTADVTITVPSVTVGGSPLEDNVDMYLSIDGEPHETVNDLQPGATVLRNIALAEGKHTISVYCSNEAGGSGATVSVTTYTGEDAPMAVTNIQVNIDETGNAVITWDAPQGPGINGGWVNPEKLNYTIKRNNEVIAEDVTATTYTDQLGTNLSYYVWTVTAFSGEKEGLSADSEGKQYGDALTIPYSQTFDTESSILLYTIVDNNKDDNTWELSSNVLRYTYSSSNDADDYAMTPPIEMSGDKVYELTLVAQSYSTSYPERVEVTLGTSLDPADHTTTIIPATDLTTGSMENLTAYFKAPADGKFYVGIHAISDADMFYLDVESISIVDGPSLDAPQAVTDIETIPGEKGATTVTINFKAPTKSFGEADLTEDVTVRVVRGDTLEIANMTLAPGAEGSAFDEEAANGNNSYVIYTSNSAGNGDYATVTCFCGYAVPGPVEDFSVVPSADNMSATITWSAPTGGAGEGYFDPAELTYTVYYVDQETQTYVAIDETTEFTYTVDPVEDTALAGYTYAVSASNLGGESSLVGQTVVLGTPYSAPFEETLANGTLSTNPWYINSSGFVTAGLLTDGSSFGVDVVSEDGGMFGIFDAYGFGGGSASLQVPKMTLQELDAPVLYFSLFHYEEEGSLSVSVSTDEVNYTPLFEKALTDAPQGWVEYEVDLAAYKDAPWISINFTGTVSSTSCIFIDYIRVEKSWINNIMVNKFEGPSKLAAGQEGTFNVQVSNKGSEAAAFTVNLSVDGAFVEAQQQTEAIAKGETASLSFTYTPNVEQIGKAVEVSVEAVLEGATDEYPDDNVKSLTLHVSQPDLPVITDLTGTCDASLQNVTLTWSEPLLVPETTVDDMESYEGFILEQIGEYVLIDGDGLGTYGLSGATFPNAYSPMAFMVWSPAEANIGASNLLPYSGSKCLISFASEPDGSGAGNDDWLISPAIVGGTELSFYAAIADPDYPESFEVLYSTTTQDRDAFTVLSAEMKTTQSWEQFIYTLPADAKYFAIHYNAIDAFALMIDDLSYVKASSNVDITFIGYNVYLNGSKLTETPIAETTYNYTSETPASELSFNVTVVYDEGESLMSNTKTFTSGVTDVKSLGMKAYGVDGAIKIENVEGHMVSIYTTEGKLLRSLKATDNSINVPVNRGVYVVKVDEKASAKVQVK